MKLCRRGQLGIFLTWAQSKADTSLMCVGVPEIPNRKKSEGSGQLTTCISYQGSKSYTQSVELIVGWTMYKALPFCFSPILITSCLRRKDTRLSPWYTFVFWVSLGMRLILIMHFCVKMQNLTPTVSNNAFTQCTLIFYCYIIQMSCHVNKHETLVMLKIGKHNCSHSSVFWRCQWGRASYKYLDSSTQAHRTNDYC